MTFQVSQKPKILRGIEYVGKILRTGGMGHAQKKMV